MMKLIKILSLSLLLTPTTAYAQNFVEGIHYSRMEHRTGASPSNSKDDEVVEYFSFSCPGCYAIEPAVKALKKSSQTLNFRKVHMPFGGQLAKYSQKAFVLMTLLTANQHQSAIFDRIHVKKNPFNSDKELIDFFHSLGYQRTLIESSLDSFSADMLRRKMNQEAKSNQIESVPTITVNNEFKVNVRAVNTADELNALIHYLNSL